jgi:hypothetical protein
LAGAWVWSGAAGGVFAVWAQTEAGINAAARSAAKAGRRAADSLIRETRIRFIGSVVVLVFD